MEALYRDFAPKGVKFYFVYKALAHPELHGYVEPYTLEERLAHVQEAIKRLKTTIPWIVDPMDNRLKHAFGDQPNAEFVLDPDGIVVVKRAWSDPEALRQDLERLVGKPETRTDPADLGLGQITAVVTADRPEELPVLVLPPNLVPVVVRPELKDGEPFYAKLRVEVERSVLSEGAGLVYFDLRLDPLYRVHWNNLVGPVRIELLTEGDGPTFEATVLTAPQPDEEQDMAPREWLVRVTNARRGDSFRAVVHYAACSDEEGWCKILSQSYTIRLQPDQDAGRVIRRRPARPVRATQREEVAARRELATLTVSAVDPDKRRIRAVDADGQEHSIRLLPRTRVLKDGKPVSLTGLKPSARIAVQGRAVGEELWAVRVLLLDN